MKKKNVQELRSKTVVELNDMAKQKKADVLKLQREKLTGKHKNMRLVKNTRLDLAQILTISQEKVLEGGK